MRTALSLAFLAILGCGTTLPTAKPAVPHARVLFVGNSLTFFNDLPATVVAIAASAGDTMLVTSSVGSGLTLRDHLNGGSDAVPQVKNNHWDYVVLQQGHAAPGGLCPDTMVLLTRMFDSLVRPRGGRIALYMTWAAPWEGEDAWTDVRTSYQLAAQAVDGLFLPAGEAWHIALSQHPGLPLYATDGSHPSPMGSYLAALEIYERLSDRDARTFTTQAFNAGQPMPMSADTIRWLQEAAHAANVAYPVSAKATPSPPTTLGC